MLNLSFIMELNLVSTILNFSPYCFLERTGIELRKRNVSVLFLHHIFVSYSLYISRLSAGLLI